LDRHPCREKSNPRTRKTVLKILIAEDNDKMRKLLKSLCVGPGDEVIECRDGAEAVRSHEVHRPDWVLMDLSMPGMDGLEAIQTIHAQHPQARIVVVSERPEADYGERARRAGAVDYVNKEDLLRLPTILKQP
jgi:CheY-like chemotaxis protein